MCLWRSFSDGRNGVVGCGEEIDREEEGNSLGIDVDGSVRFALHASIVVSIDNKGLDLRDRQETSHMYILFGFQSYCGTKSYGTEAR